MMSGAWKPVSINRALVLDVVHFARSVPSFSVEREFDLHHLARLRKARTKPVSWATLFVKAYALVVTRQPELRQTFIGWPVPRLYQAADAVASVAIARTYLGEDRLCWGRFFRPDAAPLDQLQSQLARYQQLPVDEIFRRQVRLSRLPTWLRRLAWRIGLYVHVSQRARRFGTFSVSSLGREGAVNRTHPSIHTTSLTYGPIDASGKCIVTLLCDHRVLDGVAATRALSDLEAVLAHEMVQELSGLSIVRAAAWFTRTHACQ
jgi:hypothetical protein